MRVGSLVPVVGECGLKKYKRQRYIFLCDDAVLSPLLGVCFLKPQRLYELVLYY